MSDASILKSHIETYQNNLQLLSQQQPSLFRRAVMTSTQKGEGAAPVDQVAKAEAIDINTRNQVKPLIPTVHDRRWEFPISKGWGDIIDEIDKLKIGIELSGAYTQTGLAAINREYDDEVIRNFFATAKTGRDGSDTETFPAGNVVAVDVGAAADTGMNTDKLLEARRLILDGDVNMADPNNQLWCAIDPLQEKQLLEEVKVVNKDYQDQAVLSGNGKALTSWFGINFIVTNRLQVDSNADFKVPFWAKAGMHLGIWMDLKADIRERTDLNLNPDHITVNSTFGGTRIEEAKVMQILCDPTVV